MFSTITTGSVRGIDSMLMQVEVDIAKTMPAFDMVGMLSGEVKDITILKNGKKLRLKYLVE